MSWIDWIRMPTWKVCAECKPPMVEIAHANTKSAQLSSYGSIRQSWRLSLGEETWLMGWNNEIFPAGVNVQGTINLHPFAMATNPKFYLDLSVWHACVQIIPCSSNFSSWASYISATLQAAVHFSVQYLGSIVSCHHSQGINTTWRRPTVSQTQHHELRPPYLSRIVIGPGLT